MKVQSARSTVRKLMPCRRMTEASLAHHQSARAPSSGCWDSTTRHATQLGYTQLNNNPTWTQLGSTQLGLNLDQLGSMDPAQQCSRKNVAPTTRTNVAPTTRTHVAPTTGTQAAPAAGIQAAPTVKNPSGTHRKNPNGTHHKTTGAHFLILPRDHHPHDSRGTGSNPDGGV